MGADASIYGLLGRGVQPVEDPINALTKALQAQGLQRQSQMQEQAYADDQALRDATRASGGDNNRLLQLLQQGGQYGAAEKVRKAMQDAAKAGVDLEHTQAQTAQQRALAKKTLTDAEAGAIAQHRDLLSNVTTPDEAMQWAQIGRQSGVLDDQKYALAVANIQRAAANPEAFNAWKTQAALGATKFIEMNKPTYQTRNMGGSTDTIQLPGLIGAPSVVNSVQNTQSPDNKASNDRMAADAKASREQAERHFRENKDFQRETAAVAMSKPFEVTGPDGNPLLVQQDKQGNIVPVKGFGPKAGTQKPLTDAQAKANLFGSRMQESHRILNELEGQYWPGAVNAKMSAEEVPLVGGVAGYAGNLMLTSEGQRAEQAQRDFINAVLRRESGAVISPAEFANANKQYFPQPGNDKKTIEQKRRNRELAIRGLEVEVPNGFRTVPTLTSPGKRDNGASGGWDDKNDPLGMRR